MAKNNKAKKNKEAPKEIKAQLRYLRMSPRKVRVVTESIKEMPAQEAESYLKLVNKAASAPLMKLIHSAIANGEDRYSLQKEDLYIKKIAVNEGPTLKRWMPRAFGRATPIRKRSSHIVIVLGEKKSGVSSEIADTKAVKKDVKFDKKKKSNAKKEEIETVSLQEAKKGKDITQSQEETGDKDRKDKKGGFSRKMFSRKIG